MWPALGAAWVARTCFVQRCVTFLADYNKGICRSRRGCSDVPGAALDRQTTECRYYHDVADKLYTVAPTRASTPALDGGQPCGRASTASRIRAMRSRLT